MNLPKVLYRSWYYFRTGYSVYLALLIGFFGNIVVIYKLAIQDAITSPGTVGEVLRYLFPRLTNFVVIVALIATPVCIYFGLLHMKKTGAFAADASVSTESNPYVYRVVPGKEQEVFLPLMILTAQGLAKVMDRQTDMTPEEKRQFEEVLAKANMLLKGQTVGVAKRR